MEKASGLIRLDARAPLVQPLRNSGGAPTVQRFHTNRSMGLHMDDIHTPTVTSGPTTGLGPANGVEKENFSLMDLIDEKTRVEEELSALGSVLDSVCLPDPYVSNASYDDLFVAWR